MNTLSRRYEQCPAMKPDLLNVSKRRFGLSKTSQGTLCHTLIAVSITARGLTADFQMAKVNYRQ